MEKNWTKWKILQNHSGGMAFSFCVIAVRYMCSSDWLNCISLHGTAVNSTVIYAQRAIYVFLQFSICFSNSRHLAWLQTCMMKIIRVWVTCGLPEIPPSPQHTRIHSLTHTPTRLSVSHPTQAVIQINIKLAALRALHLDHQLRSALNRLLMTPTTAAMHSTLSTQVSPSTHCSHE